MGLMEGLMRVELEYCGSCGLIRFNIYADRGYRI